MDDEKGYREIVREFNKIYIPFQKKYGLRIYTHFSLFDGGLIEIWEYQGETRKKCVCNVRNEDDIRCYKTAIGRLKYYQKEREAVEI